MNQPPRSRLARLLGSHALLAVVAIVMMLPFVWMVLASFKTVQDIEGPSIVPTVWHPENYKRVFQLPRVSFARYYFNSLFVAAWVTFLTCFTSALAAFAFARLKWRGRDGVFVLYLATLMVPGFDRRWINSYRWALYLGFYVAERAIDSYLPPLDDRVRPS